MGLFDRLFLGRTKKVQAEQVFKMLNGYQPAFMSWNGQLYESQLVRTAIDARSRHISKLDVSIEGSALPKLKTRLRNSPNEFQTWGQFLYRLNTILDMQNTAIIFPIIDVNNDLLGYYPALPSQCQIVESRSKLYLRYQFNNGQVGAVELNRCGIMTKFQYSKDFFGEDNTALTPTMQLINLQNQAIREGMKSSASFRFMATLSNFKDEDDLAEEQKNFTSKNLSADAGGFLLFPNTYRDVKQIISKPFTVDAEQMKIIQKNVYDYFGVNEEIIQNSAMGDKLDAFFNGAIEPFAIQLSDVLTKMTYTEAELSYGNKIYVTANRLQYMSVEKKISMAQALGDRGYIMIDEIRELFNYPPLPNGEGQKAPIRGEYYFVNDEENNSEENSKEEQNGNKTE